MQQRGGQRRQRNEAKQSKGCARRQEFIERVGGVHRRVCHDGAGGGQDAGNIRSRQAGKSRQSFVAARPFADGDQSESKERTERNANAGADEALLDRITHEKYAAERERDAADPNDPAGAKTFLKADRSRWRCWHAPSR